MSISKSSTVIKYVVCGIYAQVVMKIYRLDTSDNTDYTSADAEYDNVLNGNIKIFLSNNLIF